MTSLFDLPSQATAARCPRARRVTGHPVGRRYSWTTPALMSVMIAGVFGSTVACRGKDAGKPAFESNMARPDVLPTMLNKDLPFRYPPALYAEKVQGNVFLRLFVDTNGMVINDSTRVVTSSNVAMLDSAAVQGSRDLRFVPAKLRGAPMAVSILFPVYFRHPEAPPPAGDTILHPVPVGQGVKTDSAKKDTAHTATSGKGIAPKKSSSH